MDRRYARPLGQPDEIIPFELGRAEMIQLGELTVGRVVQEPGWRWSEHVKPLVGTDWCQSHHYGLVESGRCHVQLSDGTEFEVGPGDVFEIPPGHDAWVLGDEPFVEFDFGGLRHWLPSGVDAGERVLATVLFTDIVGSTSELARIGDAAWRARLDDHDEIARRVLERHRGRLIKSTGDGVLAAFDGAARAVHAAAGIRDGLLGIGITIRAAVHSGEVELAGDDLRGVAVHVAARLLDLGGPGDVVVSATTRDLTSGSGLAFEARGTHELRGLEGPRPVFVLVPSAGVPSGSGGA